MPTKTDKTKKKTGIMKEMDCSDELQDVIKQKKAGRGEVMKLLWKYIKKHDLQSSSNRRIVKCDDKLKALFAKVIKKERTLVMRGKKIKVPAGRIFMTEFGGAIGKHLS